ncbi:MAG TPA: fused MFS/spermidine synthase [Gemmatimonadaceae bacterium]|nr:fused MFS/spermidine synthase [Gemmatimonadaceae bacterium]
MSAEQSTDVSIAPPEPSSAPEPSLTGKAAVVLLAVFATAIFFNAALLFSVQPMFTKMVLPLLGGSPAVWNTCLLFFQALLLAGYLYAHLTSRFLSARKQAVLHLALLISAVVLLPIHVPASWAHPPGTSLPIGWLLGLLTVSLGLPFFLLSAGAPMMQRWFAGTRHASAHNPYFLYAASNLGSFASLLAYPFLIEPRMRISEQAVAWLGFYSGLLVLIGGCAVATHLFRRTMSAPTLVPDTKPVTSEVPLVEDSGGIHLKRRGALRGSMRFLIEENPSVIRRFLQGRDAPITNPTIVPDRNWRLRWVLLSFAPSSLLIGTTTYLSTDIASVPFLWVIPLALYLLTFVLVFAERPLFPRWLMLHVQLVLGLALIVALCLGAGRGILGPAALHLTAFFVTAMMCHRELADSRPRVEYLTEFYLWMSLGGVLGGVFNVLLAPVLYDSLVEYPFALVVAFGLRPGLARTYGTRLDFIRDLLFPAAVAATVWFAFRLPKPPDEWFSGGSQVFLAAVAIVVLFFWKRPFRLALGAGAIYAGTQLAGNANSNILMQDRSFFGMYRVRRIAEYHVLQNGTTTHGGQSRELTRRMDPLTYYYKEGPLGDIFAKVAQKPVRRVAMVGLGTGTIACYGRPEEHWTFYEIDPMVADIARAPRNFTYLRDCAPRTNIVIGDARLSLAAAADREFDIIVLDAFTSDAIPAHLVTREALALYLQKLRDDGVVAFHISNRYLDLRPVIIALANDARVAGALGERAPDTEGRGKLYYGSRWMVLAKNASVLSELVKLDGWHALGTWPESRLWTDDYTDVLAVLKWR